MNGKKIDIPYKYTPRDYQKPFWKAMAWGCKRALLIRHRRAGKDKDSRNYMIYKAVSEPGNYFYAFPSYNQGRKAIWDNIDNDWFRLTNHIPEELIEGMNANEMMIKLKSVNGWEWSTIQIVGTDGKNIDRLVGTNPKWVVFSEWALQNPKARDFIRPIMLMNWGWAVFNSTPRWKNHLYDMVVDAKDNPSRYLEVLKATDTIHNGERILTDEMLQEEKETMDQDVYLQEYFCSFEAAIQWSYYSKQMRDALEQNRICSVPHDEWLPVYTVWDLWIKDATAIWFYQVLWKEVRCIEYEEFTGESLGAIVSELRRKPYDYWTVYLPHDAYIRELWTWKSRAEFLLECWISDISPVPKLWVQDGIECGRRLFPRVWFDKEKCKDGIRCLNEYHKKRDDVRMMFKSRPEHDRSSHGADAYRYLAVSLEEQGTQRKNNMKPLIVEY